MLDVELVLPGRVPEEFTPTSLSLESLAPLKTISPFKESRFTVASPSLAVFVTPRAPSSRWASLELLNGALLSKEPFSAPPRSFGGSGGRSAKPHRTFPYFSDTPTAVAIPTASKVLFTCSRPGLGSMTPAACTSLSRRTGCVPQGSLEEDPFPCIPAVDGAGVG